MTIILGIGLLCFIDRWVDELIILLDIVMIVKRGH